MFALICLLPFVLLLSWMLTFQLEHVHEAGIVVARDSIAYGIRMYSNAFQGYMRGQGSYAQGIFPMTSADLAPFGYRAPQTPPGGGVWSLGVATRAGAHSPFVCLSASVNGPGEL